MTEEGGKNMTKTIGETSLQYHGHWVQDDEYEEYQDQSYVRDIKWSPDGTFIASAGSGDNCTLCTVKIWTPVSGLGFECYSKRQEDLISIAWSPDGKHIASKKGSYNHDHGIEVWEPRTGKTYSTYNAYSKAIGAFAWSPKGTYLACFVEEDNGVHVWDAFTGDLHLTYRGHSGDGSYIEWSKPENLGQIDYIYERSNGNLGTSIAWSPKGRFIASACPDNSVHVWEVLTGKTFCVFKNHTADVLSVAWSPDGRFIASTSTDGTFQIWDSMTGKRRIIDRRPSVGVWSPD
jgi:WD40 repeat protein